MMVMMMMKKKKKNNRFILVVGAGLWELSPFDPHPTSKVRGQEEGDALLAVHGSRHP